MKFQPYKSALIPLTAILMALASFVSCDFISKDKDGADEDNNGMAVVDCQVLDDSVRTIIIDTKLTKEAFIPDINDSTKVKVKITESDKFGIPFAKVAQPQLVKADNIAAKKLKKEDIAVIAIVDITMPEKLIAEARKYVDQIHSLFYMDNLYLVLLKHNGQYSEIMPATQYVIDNHITSYRFEEPDDEEAAEETPMLLRSLLGVYEELNKQDTDSISPAYKIKNSRSQEFVMFSDGNLYDDINGTPLDPQHFQIQEKLVSLAHKLPEKNNFFYVNIDGSEEGEFGEGNSFYSVICNLTNGAFYEEWNWEGLYGQILKDSREQHIDYRFILRNPDMKVFVGATRQICITLTDPQDNPIVSATTSYSIGSFFSPVIVDSLPLPMMILQGLIIGAIILLLTYIILQFLLPFALYKRFQRKNVTYYKGPGNSFNGKYITDTCYLCKAPFRPGEKVVAKCSHIMHLDCWNENDQHCPEYGRQCKEGSHYYNSSNLFDPRNASFLTKWIISGIISGIAVWFFYMTIDITDAYMWMIDMLHDNQLEYKDYPVVLLGIPLGFFVGITYTTAFCLLTVRHTTPWKYISEICTRAACAAFLSMSTFMLFSVIIIIIGLKSEAALVLWIPWTISIFIIAFTSTWHTRSRISYRYLLISCAAVILSLLIWVASFHTIIALSVPLLILSLIIIGIGIAVSIAVRTPRSEHYFLRIEGPVKTMDIAIYKWLKANPHTPVNIGKSVDCNIQMSWDIRSNIAPIHAAVKLKNGYLTLTAFEDGVLFNDKPLKPESKPRRLYHGKSFTIGETTFTYIEKDT